jgi:hypothetical protein
MRHKLSMLPVLFAALAGLLSEAQAAAQLDPENSARVRVYREADITLYPGEYCYGSDSPQAIHASDGAPSLFSFNKKVGMPVTDDIAGAYNEYVIPAGKPTAVMLQWQAERRCGSGAAPSAPLFSAVRQKLRCQPGLCTKLHRARPRHNWRQPGLLLPVSRINATLSAGGYLQTRR